ncbi:MAG: MOSC N-terminal beta barrel domain-containing protein [Myxococcales bacterium]
MREATVRELWTYPVKGCQGIASESIEVTQMGVVGDRGFVLWRDGKLVDQIETPQVASLEVGFDRETGTLRFEHAEHGRYEHVITAHGPVREAKWILDEFETLDQGDAVADWISSALGKDVRLVSPGESWKINFPIPQMQRLHQQPKQSFYSASPVSLANQASLDDLNGRLAQPVGMDRFRMNVVIDGLEAYEEDERSSFGNPSVELLNVTPAERCVIVTTDQKTGARPKSDLLKVLGGYRRKKQEDRFGSGITFGLYMGVGREGMLRVGDKLEVA